MLSKEARNAHIEWESHGFRIIKSSFKTKKGGIMMNTIHCYVRSNDSNEDNKVILEAATDHSGVPSKRPDNSDGKSKRRSQN
ncbi:unnamed protein product [Schistosoma mattheei]|uniref:Uncharacterized protein n=1 Tax=Schistosoma mattheei TaxID=31246 RepID=A0A183P526_9TREM|nr:unnamed protein product [Schistosoma mattheei]